MNEQFIYMTLARNIHTGLCLIKVGFTTNPDRRLYELRSRNNHFEYSEMMLFKHKTKLLHYEMDEKLIHTKNKYYRTTISTNSLPEGNSEHYESVLTDELYEQLLDMGYNLNNEPEPVKETAMFEWS
ncbi:GIY-YIG nuclease family protein [Cronobacter sakazakii]|nr:GIY-YIG nuclease family protein [Cronobacter sakazakii]